MRDTKDASVARFGELRLQLSLSCRVLVVQKHGESSMTDKFIHMSSRSLERTVAAIMVYWIALGVAALILALAVRQDATSERGVRPPYLAAIARGALSATMTSAA
jgi:hypothetical protein